MSTRIAVPMVLMLFAALLLSACGSPAQTPTPTPAATAAPTGGDPTPTAQATATPTSGRDMAAYYRGKTIRFVVGFAPGGGYDLQARGLASIMPRYLPGSPRMIVENLTGAGGLRGKAKVYESAPDGLTVGIIHGRNTLPVIMGDTVEGFDPFRVRLIGTAEYTPSRAFFSVRRQVATSWDQMTSLGRPVTTGETEPGFQGAVGMTFLEIKGYPIRTVYGYGGTSEILAGVDRGELDGTTRGQASTIQRLYPEWISGDYIVPVFQYGGEPILPFDIEPWGMTADQVPHLFDLVDMTPVEREAFENFRDFTFSKTVFLPPNTPDDIYEAWKQAFMATVQDPDYIAFAEAQGIEVGVATGDELTELMERGQQMSPEVQAFFRRLQAGQ